MFSELFPHIGQDFERAKKDAHILAIHMGIAIAVAIFLTCKAIELVWRVLSQHPNSALLWVLTVLTVGSFAAAAFLLGLGETEPLLNGLALASLFCLLVTAKVIETRDGQFMSRHVTYELLVDDMLHRPWFKLDPR